MTGSLLSRLITSIVGSEPLTGEIPLIKPMENHFVNNLYPKAFTVQLIKVWQLYNSTQSMPNKIKNHEQTPFSTLGCRIESVARSRLLDIIEKVQQAFSVLLYGVRPQSILVVERETGVSSLD